MFAASGSWDGKAQQVVGRETGLVDIHDERTDGRTMGKMAGGNFYFCVAAWMEHLFETPTYN